MMSDAYTRDYLDRQRSHSLRSATKIVPLVVEEVAPRSVVDVGCGIGAWLSVFSENGVDDVFGLDGDYVAPESLLIPAERFSAVDLRSPFQLERVFDLAISLEVAEHLPERSANGFVSSLCALAPVVLFSAAVPGQGGRAHLNEQWQSYWASRFERHGFTPVDIVRPRVWEDQTVAWWYAQNTLVYVHDDEWQRYPRLAARRGPLLRDVVHPGMYIRSQTTPAIAAQLRRALAHSLRVRIDARLRRRV